MTDKGSIFRPEAVAHSRRQSGPGDVLRAAPRWTSWFFYVLLGLVLAALVASSLITVDRYARGPVAVDQEGRVVVLLPVSAAPRITAGNRVEVGGRTAEVVSARDSVLDPSEVENRYSIEVAVPSVAVITSSSEAEVGEVARVLVQSDPAIIQFVPGLDRLFGGDGA
jgi:hypothetical protein